MKKLLGALLGLMIWQSAGAIVLEGYEIPESVEISKKGTTLQLQGAAVRSWYFVVKGYIGALYLQNPSSSVVEILTDESHQRMSFTLLFEKMSARRIANSFSEAIQINTSDSEQSELMEELDLFMSMLDGSLNQGEAGIIEYIPGIGTQFTVAGEKKGVVPGKRIFNALLKVWIGETPPSQQFKDDILGIQAKT